MKKEFAYLHVVLVEDNPLDVIIIRECFHQVAKEVDITHFPNGESAIGYLNALSERLPDPLPGLILVNRDIPIVSGLEVLKTVRSHTRLQGIPVIMFSAAESPEQVAEAFQLGANSCIQKISIEKYYRHLIIELARFWTEASLRPRETGLVLSHGDALDSLEILPN